MKKASFIYVPVFSVTLLLSAFLLFLIQPMFTKMILPLLGGSPSVWNTAIVFFQATLLAGYSYAWITSRFLKPSWQAVLHIVLLAGFATMLPVAIPAGWEPPKAGNPALWQIGMMTVALGGPFFILSATAPLLQRWFSFTSHAEAHNPYFLYAASNLGSLSALLLYPFLFEPLLPLQAQGSLWSLWYQLLIIMIAVCAIITSFRSSQGTPSPELAANDNGITRGRVISWLALSFVPSSLMLGVTTYITTDLASIPLLWIIPLTLYISTFIIAFSRFKMISLNRVLELHGIFLAAVITSFVYDFKSYELFTMAVHLALFFLTSLFCHMQLAATKPDARHLTEFYLLISAGGVLGGIFTALIAPQIFIMPLEYALVLGAAAFLRYQPHKSQGWQEFIARRNPASLAQLMFLPLLTIACSTALIFAKNQTLILCLAAAVFIYLFFMIRRRWAFAMTVAALILLHPGFDWRVPKTSLALERNYFGVLRVSQGKHVRNFVHGSTLHGSQPLDKFYRLTPISYYFKEGPASDIFQAVGKRPGAQRIGALGLGIGSIACYNAPGRHFDFFEIDTDVAKIAENKKLFTYLSDCGSPYSIIIGDGRLQISKAPQSHYDLIFLDAFSSDNIPVHTMTREAFALYAEKIKPDGLIAINLSNRYFDLRPVVAAIAQDLGLHVRFRSDNGGTVGTSRIRYAPSIYAVLSRDPVRIKPFFPAKGWVKIDADPSRIWRDDYSNVVGALKR